MTHFPLATKWQSEIVIIDGETSEVLSNDNTQVTAQQYIHNHKLEIVQKTTTAKINQHEKTAKRTIYWHCKKRQDKQLGFWNK